MAKLFLICLEFKYALSRYHAQTCKSMAYGTNYFITQEQLPLYPYTMMDPLYAFERGVVIEQSHTQEHSKDRDNISTTGRGA